MDTALQTTVDEIADGIFRLSTWVPGITEHGFTFNQFLLTGEQPFLFHCGMRQLYPLVSAAIGKVIPLQRLRWISFAHLEADECGAMTLLAGDLLTHVGRCPSLTETDCVAPALEAESLFHATGLTTNLAPTLDRLAQLQPTTLALMHGASFAGDGAAQLRGLSDGYAAMAD
jgi:hypothetical protein